MEPKPPCRPREWCWSSTKPPPGPAAISRAYSPSNVLGSGLPRRSSGCGFCAPGSIRKIVIRDGVVSAPKTLPPRGGWARRWTSLTLAPRARSGSTRPGPARFSPLPPARVDDIDVLIRPAFVGGQTVPIVGDDLHLPCRGCEGATRGGSEAGD